jgi:hypothetical protein
MGKVEQTEEEFFRMIRIRERKENDIVLRALKRIKKEEK